VGRRISTRPSTTPPAATTTTTETEFTFSEPSAAGVAEEKLNLGGEIAPQGYGVVNVTSTATADAPDGYIDRLVKYIPSEIIALYLGVANVVPVTDPSYHLALWIVFGAATVCTPIYMYFVTQAADEPTLWSQIVISSIAFPIWVFAIGGPFRFLSWYEGKHWVAAVVLTFATFLAGIHRPSAPEKTVPSV
jgi:hypothetical protein